MLNKLSLHSFLKSIGIKNTDTVLIHTSYKSLGGFEGGPDGFLDAFISYLDDGLFIVPTHTWANVNKDNPVYEVDKSIPCIGVVPTIAAFKKEMVRSLHPTHSVAVYGKRALDFIKGEELSETPCPKNGVWDRLYKENATILLIGVKLNRNTYMHVFDESFNLPNRLSKPFNITVKDKNGVVRTGPFYPHNGAFSEYFINYYPALEFANAIKYARLGDAIVEVFNVKKGTDLIKHILSKTTFDVGDDYKTIPESLYNDFK
ncbi:MAG: AAC(3) family N-acetyltransferase [Clostridia bacterium]|nr:AAC(3) family N-acetyltransferase [Clostridia bacterium]